MPNNGYLGPVLVCSNKSTDKTAFSFENSVCYALHFALETENYKLIFIPNLKRGDPREFSFRFSGKGFYHSVAYSVEDETNWFINAYAPEISKAEECFGIGNVRVEWGVLNW